MPAGYNHSQNRAGGRQKKHCGIERKLQEVTSPHEESKRLEASKPKVSPKQPHGGVALVTKRIL